jgi:hypothetical protein
MFGVSYKESYKRYPRYIKELRKTIHDPVLLMLLFDDHSEVTHDPRQF